MVYFVRIMQSLDIILEHETVMLSYAVWYNIIMMSKLRQYYFILTEYGKLNINILNVTIIINVSVIYESFYYTPYLKVNYTQIHF